MTSVGDTLRSHGRKRARRYPELLPAQRDSGPAGSTNASSTVPVSITGSSAANLAGFGSIQIPAILAVSSGLSASSTSICTASSVSTPLTSNLPDAAAGNSAAAGTGNSASQPPLSSRFDPGKAARPERALSTTTAGSSAGSSLHREGLVLLANCAVSRPDDVITAPTQVKVEPEVVLADYELTAMNTPEASFYERKRMAAAETSSGTIRQPPPPTLSDLHVTPPPLVTGSRSRSPGGRDVGPMTSVNGRTECRECGRQFASVVAYNKHALIHRLETINIFSNYL